MCRACPQGYLADFLNPCGPGILWCDSNITCCIVLSKHCTAIVHILKPKGQVSSAALLLEDVVLSTSTVPLHQDARIHTSVHWSEGSKGDNPRHCLASAGHQISLFSSSSHKLSRILIQAFLLTLRGCGVFILGETQNLTVGDPVQLQGLKRSMPKLTYPTEVLPMQLPALTTCHYSRGAIWAPPWGTDFFHPALKVD